MVSYTRRDGHELDNEGTVFTASSTRTAPNPQDTSSNALLGRVVFTPNDQHRFRLTAEYGDGAVDFADVLSSRSATVLDLAGRDTYRADAAQPRLALFRSGARSISPSSRSTGRTARTGSSPSRTGRRRSIAPG